MRKWSGVLVVMAVVFSSLFFVSMADTRDTSQNSLHDWCGFDDADMATFPNEGNEGHMFLAQSARRYIPEVRLMVSTNDGWSWEEQFNVRDVEIGEPFLLMVQASVRVPGFFRQRFGASYIVCTLAFSEDQVLDISLINSSVFSSSSSLERTVDGLYVVDSVTDNAAVGGTVGDVTIGVLADMALAAVVSPLVERKMREGRHDRALNDFLWGNHDNAFRGYSFPIPTTPISDSAWAGGARAQNVSLIFEVRPLRRGAQTIKVFFDNRVSPIYMKTFTLLVEP